MTRRNGFVASVLLLAACQAAHAATIRIEIRGRVEWNQFTFGLLDPVSPNDPVTMSFEVDSEVFVNHPQYPVRGYPLNARSFNFQLGDVNAPLLSPMPAGVVPYFVIRNNDPAVDGFMFSSGLGYPEEVLLSIGAPSYGVSFYRTFIGASTLHSLDILDALGSWGFENLSVFHWAVQIGEFSTPLGILYQTIELSIVCETGDVDGNAVTDLADYAAFSECMDGPDSAVGGTCTCADMDQDEDVDLRDCVELQRAFAGT